MIPASSPASFSHKSYESGVFQTADGLYLFEQSWHATETPRSIIAIVHGYAEHSGRYTHLAQHLNQHQHTVHTYDQRGYGRSEGRPGYVGSFDHYLDDLGTFLSSVRQRHPDTPLFLFGHSMGGAVSLLYCLEREANLKGVIFSSPMLKVSEDMAPLLQKASSILGRFLPWLPTIPLDRSLISRDPEVVHQALHDPLNYHGRLPARTGAEMLKAMERIQSKMQALSLPMLVIHGTADKLTDPSGSLAFYRTARSEDKTLGFYPGLYHETFNEPEKEQVFEEIVAWMDEHLEDSPTHNQETEL